MSNEIPHEWYFITSPQQVSWNKNGRSNTIEPYGTNNPYLSYGTTGLRELSLGDSMVEGFSDGKVVEDNILNLEACMRMVLNSEDGYAAPYCWDVYAGGKKYGTYVIQSVSVQEEIRDTDGRASRAKVDLQLQEVAPYQVSSGIDITAEAISGELNEDAVKALEEQQKADEKKKQDDKAKDSKDKNGKDKPSPKDSSNKGNGNNSSSSSSNSGGNTGGGSDTGSSAPPPQLNINGID
jgi:uncharacterized membrane protein YgcG